MPYLAAIKAAEWPRSIFRSLPTPSPNWRVADYQVKQCIVRYKCATICLLGSTKDSAQIAQLPFQNWMIDIA
jgi:hypothetical protein